MKKVKYRITGNGVAERDSADLPVLHRTGGGVMSDQCRACVYRGDIKGCESVECTHHESWYVSVKQARIEALEGELAAVTTGLNGYEEQSWCECGHEMELVRPGKFQKCGCCEKVEMLQARIEALEAKAQQVLKLALSRTELNAGVDMADALDELAALLKGEQ